MRYYRYLNIKYVKYKNYIINGNFKYMYCNNCGNKLSQDSNFCNKCEEQIKNNNKIKTDFHSYIYHFKCRPCQLEFSLFSWKDDWATKFSPFCPECGKQDTFFQIMKTSEKMISTLVYNENI